MDNLIDTLSSAMPNPAIASSSSTAIQGQESFPSVMDSIHNPQVSNDNMDLGNPKTVNKPPIFPEMLIFLEVTG